MYNPNLPDIKQEESSHNNTGNMYSYKDDNNINNPNEMVTGAIRRSIGDGNPNAFYPKPSYNLDFAQNNMNNINNINTNDVQIRQTQSDDGISNNSFLKWVPSIIFGCVEILMIILIGCIFKWDMRNDPQYYLVDKEKEENETINEEIIGAIRNATFEELNIYDGLFKDINIMVFVGFGMFHTLLKRYSWTSISINMMAIAFSFQIGLFTNLLWANSFREKWQKGVLNFESFIKSIFNSCTTLVSLGCVLGKLSSTQYIIMIIIETIMSSLNFQLCDVKLETIDVGGALYIHTFGTIFGLAIYMVLFCKKKMKSKIIDFNYFNNSNYFSNITSMIGILFLWFYFPSFNSGLVLSDNARYRSCINTYFSLFGSTVASFMTSALFNQGRFVFEHILFGCFSGGVIISGCCSVCIDHWAALLIGFICGGICVTFLSKLKPYFINWGFFDIYNIICVHGVPGILGAFITAMMIGDINKRVDNKKLDYHYILMNDMDRGNNIQAGVQIGAIFITLGLSFVSGIATGYLMKVSTCGKINNYFSDSEIFENKYNIIDNLEQNQFYYGEINRASLFQTKMEFPPQKSSSSDEGVNRPSFN